MSRYFHLDKRMIELFGELLIALKSFEGKYHKKFNFSKLTKHFHIEDRDAKCLLDFLLEFQYDLREFSNIIEDYKLVKKQEERKTYIITKKIFDAPLKTIHLKREHAYWLSDLTYTFQHVRKGKGFDISPQNQSEAIQKVRFLMKYHSYLFEKNENNLVYPTRLASELGNALRLHEKLNKTFNAITIHGCNVEVDS